MKPGTLVVCGVEKRPAVVVRCREEGDGENGSRGARWVRVAWLEVRPRSPQTIEHVGTRDGDELHDWPVDAVTPSDPQTNFFLFAGSSYYPLGGWQDYVGTFTSLGDAMAAVEEIEAGTHVVIKPLQGHSYLWWQLVRHEAGAPALIALSGMRRGEGHWERQEKAP